MKAQKAPTAPAVSHYDLNGEWERHSGPNEKSPVISKVMIQQIGDFVVATSVTDDGLVHSGDLSFRGTYRGNSFAIEHVCVQDASPTPQLTIETVSVIDARHIEIEGGCSNKAVWTRFGNSTIALDTSQLFDTNSSEIKPDAQSILETIVRMLNKFHPEAQLLIAGYTDDLGTAAHNRQLSTRRARAVASWFGSHGLDKRTFMARGYGDKTPRYPNVNDEARAHNRRIEVVVLQ